MVNTISRVVSAVATDTEQAVAHATKSASEPAAQAQPAARRDSAAKFQPGKHFQGLARQRSTAPAPLRSSAPGSSGTGATGVASEEVRGGPRRHGPAPRNPSATSGSTGAKPGGFGVARQGRHRAPDTGAA